MAKKRLPKRSLKYDIHPEAKRVLSEILSEIQSYIVRADYIANCFDDALRNLCDLRECGHAVLPTSKVVDILEALKKSVLNPPKNER